MISAYIVDSYSLPADKEETERSDTQQESSGRGHSVRRGDAYAQFREDPATRKQPGPHHVRDEEGDYVAFLVPPKGTAAIAIQALHKHGVGVKILTGDNDLISRKVCRGVGLEPDPMLQGEAVDLFQAGWLVESLMTQTLIIHIIRTNKIPFFQSRASWSLTLTTMAIMAFGAWLPYSPLASSLGLVRLPALYWPILLATLPVYSCLTQGIKVLMLRMKWI